MATEDLTTYTETDSGGDITVTSTKADVSTMEDDAVSYVRKSFGANYFTTFEIDFEGYLDLTSESGYPFGGVCALSANDAKTLEALLADNEGVSCYFQWLDYNSTKILRLRQYWDDNGDNYTCAYDTLYYCTFKRTGSALQLLIYSDSGRTSLLDTLSVTFNSTGCEYLYAISSAGRTSPDNDTSTYYGQNYEIISAGGLSIPVAMHHYTKNIGSK